MGAPGRIASQVILKDWQKISAAMRPVKSGATPRTHTPKSAEPVEPESPPVAEPVVESSSPSAHGREKN